MSGCDVDLFVPNDNIMDLESVESGGVEGSTRVNQRSGLVILQPQLLQGLVSAAAAWLQCCIQAGTPPAVLGLLFRLKLTEAPTHFSSRTVCLKGGNCERASPIKAGLRSGWK